MKVERSVRAMTRQGELGAAEKAVCFTPITVQRTTVALLTGLLLLVVQPVEAAPAFMGLGVPDKLTPNDNITDSVAAAISADGSTVVGSVTAALRGVPGIFIDSVATRWTQATGQTFIALPPIPIPGAAPVNDFPRFAIDVSANGSVIVGRTNSSRFFKFNGTTTGTTTIFDNELRLGNIRGISGDGSTIVGSAARADLSGFVYRLTGTALADLEQLPNPGGLMGAESGRRRIFRRLSGRG